MILTFFLPQVTDYGFGLRLKTMVRFKRMYRTSTVGFFRYRKEAEAKAGRDTPELLPTLIGPYFKRIPEGLNGK